MTNIIAEVPSYPHTDSLPLAIRAGQYEAERAMTEWSKCQLVAGVRVGVGSGSS